MDTKPPFLTTISWYSCSKLVTFPGTSSFCSWKPCQSVCLSQARCTVIFKRSSKINFCFHYGKISHALSRKYIISVMWRKGTRDTKKEFISCNIFFSTVLVLYCGSFACLSWKTRSLPSSTFICFWNAMATWWGLGGTRHGIPSGGRHSTSKTVF